MVKSVNKILNSHSALNLQILKDYNYKVELMKPPALFMWKIKQLKVQQKDRSRLPPLLFYLTAFLKTGNLGSISQHDVGRKSGLKPDEKNSSERIVSSLGLDVGSGCKSR